jgi:hypothetical protein
MDDLKKGVSYSAEDKIVYSYASIVDTFFWGEKRRYLPSFQATGRKNKAQGASIFRGLRVVRGIAAARDD